MTYVNDLQLLNKDFIAPKNEINPQSPQYKLRDYGTLHVDKYLSEIAGEINKIIPFFAGNKLAITAPTGTGKTTLILENKLNLEGKTLFLVPFTSLLEQIQNDYANNEKVAIIRADETSEILAMQIYEIDKSDTIKYVVATYDNLYRFEKIKFENIVIDESHEIINAYLYRIKALVMIWKLINEKRFLNVILISATTNKLLSHSDFGFDTLTIKRNKGYDYTLNTVLYNENFVKSLAFYVGGHCQKGKILVIELNNLEQINKLKIYINSEFPELVVETVNSKAERMEKSEEYKSILYDNQIKCDILICTKFIEAGINIKNTNISEVVYVFNQTKHLDSIKQFAGRFRNMYELPITIFAKKNENNEVNYYSLSSKYNDIMSGNKENCNYCNLLLNENELNIENKENLLKEIDTKVSAKGYKPLNENDRFEMLINDKNNSLISSCYFYNTEIDKYEIDIFLVLCKATHLFQSSLNVSQFVNEVCKDTEYKQGSVNIMTQFADFISDVESELALSKENKEKLVNRCIEFAKFNENEFLQLLVRCFRQDKNLLLEFATVCKLDLQSAKIAIKQNKDTIAYEFYSENKALLRNTSILDNVAKELIVLRSYTSNNKDAFELQKRISSQKLNLDTFNDLIAFYTLSNKDFVARNPKLALQKSQVKYLIEFVEKNNYTIRYTKLVNDKKLLQYFESSHQIEKWCKILFNTNTKQISNKGIKVSMIYCFKRDFYDIDSMKNSLEFN